MEDAGAVVEVGEEQAEGCRGVTVHSSLVHGLEVSEDGRTWEAWGDVYPIGDEAKREVGAASIAARIRVELIKTPHGFLDRRYGLHPEELWKDENSLIQELITCPNFVLHGFHGSIHEPP